MATSTITVPRGFQLSTEERDRILLEQVPAVKFIARGIHKRLPRHVELDDLVDAGVIGLLDAMEKYDVEKNVQFQSYAQFRIRGAILDSLREMDWCPRVLRKKARQIEAARGRLSCALGRDANEQEIAEELGMQLHDYQLLIGEICGLDIDSLSHSATANEAEEDDLSDRIPDPKQADPFKIYEKAQMKQVLAGVVGELPERDRQILALYYVEELTMKEVAAVLGVVESRVSQMHSAIIAQLRAKLNGVLPNNFVKKSPRAPRERLQRVPNNYHVVEPTTVH